MRRAAGAALALVLCSVLTAAAQQPAPTPTPSPATPVASEYVEVTATRIPETPQEVPASVTVVTGDELRARGATTLRDALATAQGVDVAPGADNGPASSVVELWGLKEFDAFLLVIDGVPWGGAFNPSVETIDLGDVERIEVVRGAAPVMYGATSFVGVIHVVHKPAGAPGGVASGFAGNHGSGGGSLGVALPRLGALASSLDLHFQKEGFEDPRTQYRRGYAAWRGESPLGRGRLRIGLNGTLLDQQPASPQFFDGTELSPLVPLDANHNPEGAFLNVRRYNASVGYDQPAARATWSTLLSYSYATEDQFRGFLVDASTDFPNAHGFRETIHRTDVYLDSHLAWTAGARVRLVAGLDYLHGNGNASGGDFDYGVRLDGRSPPTSADLAPAADIHIHDRRDFGGLYGFAEWNPHPEWRFELGLRLNVTDEQRQTSTLDFASQELSGGEDRRTVVRPGGTVAASWTPWRQGSDELRLYADYRNTYKPAAIDFGLDTDPSILKPETADSYEGGAKSRLAGGRLELELAAFWLNFRNLVVSQEVDGLPALVNAGKERLKGIEASLSSRLAHDVRVQLAFSFHDARFTDFVSDFGDGPTQVAGNRLPASARLMAAAAVTYSPARGLNAHARVQLVGDRFLDEVNTALVPGYATVSAGLGYRVTRWEIRVDGRNLNDERAPVSLSEMGSGAFYLLPARRIDAGISVHF
ncbi:MAG TPA: TonB-dependent receptor [Vicinamibacteria bacterium]|nr:TonB-dependent receptor [Vicinamibacteria bacterium]